MITDHFNKIKGNPRNLGQGYGACKTAWGGDSQCLLSFRKTEDGLVELDFEESAFYFRTGPREARAGL